MCYAAAGKVVEGIKMSIWVHADSATCDNLDCGPRRCQFCGSDMIAVDLPDYWPCTDSEYLRIHNRFMFGRGEFIDTHGLENCPGTWLVECGHPTEMYVGLAICPVCGWWRIDKQVTLAAEWQFWDLFFIAEGVLKTLDLTDVQTPIEEIRSYLAARYDSRFDVHPRRFEEVVASVFSDFGYTASMTAYSADGGVDVILDGPHRDRVGVQVKRYKNTIKAEQIRSFVGALVLGGYDKGFYVTTSVYQRGARRVARSSTSKAVPIELFDASAFFDALGIAQLTAANLVSDTIERLSTNARPTLCAAFDVHRNSL